VASPGAVVVTGATGLVGSRLVPVLLDDGLPVAAVTRRPEETRTHVDPRTELLRWDGRELAPEDLAGAAALVHLAGEPIFGGPFTAARRRRIRDSRVDSTRALVEALGRVSPERRPNTFVCASAVGYYGSRGEELLDEDASAGDGFLAEVCRDWEAEARRAESQDVRVVSLRIGVVLAREGGALPQMALPFRLGLGGTLGDGRQWLSWIQADDLVELVRFAVREAGLRGPVNAVAPEPVRNAELTRALARQLHRPALFRVPGFVLRLVLGDLAGELLGSRRVVPRAAQEAGFRFRHPGLAEALAAELG